jgi:hypothetical protein
VVEVDAAIAAQIALHGADSDYVKAQKQRNPARPALPTTPPKPGTLRWYWTHYKGSDHWLGDLSFGHAGLAGSTRLSRTGLIESLLPENGENAQSNQGRDEGAHAVTGGQSAVGATGHDPLDDR